MKVMVRQGRETQACEECASSDAEVAVVPQGWIGLVRIVCYQCLADDTGAKPVLVVKLAS